MSVNLHEAEAVNKANPQVALLLDYSDSMREKYENGTVQKILERILPAALRLGNGVEVNTWLFSDIFKRLESLTSDNIQGYVHDKLLPQSENLGQELLYSLGVPAKALPRGLGDKALYAPVLNDVYEEYTQNAQEPGYVILVTLGEGSDIRETLLALKKYIYDKFFLKIFCIANEDCAYLLELGEMFSNVSTFNLESFEKTSDEDMYDFFWKDYVSFLEKFDENNLFTDENRKLLDNLEKPSESNFVLPSWLRLSQKAFLIFLPFKYLLFAAIWLYIKKFSIQYPLFIALEIFPVLLRFIDANIDDLSHPELNADSIVGGNMFLIFVYIIFSYSMDFGEDGDNVYGIIMLITTILIGDIILGCLPRANSNKKSILRSFFERFIMNMNH